MPDEDLQKRLESLNRGPLEGPESPGLRERVRKSLRTRRGQAGGGADAEERPAAKAAPQPIVFRRDLPRHEPPKPTPGAAAGPFVSLADAFSGGEVPGPDGLPAYVVERPLRGAEGPWDDLCEGFARTVASPSPGLSDELARAGAGGAIDPADVIFLDLETAGLGSAPLFLVGAMVWEGDGLLVRQFLARDYSEERAALGLFLDLAATRSLLVSFNGKSFDLPFLRARAAATGLPCRLDPAHLDLLHTARRVWGGELSDCRLQTLERVVCGRLRGDDIPGHLIPDVYHEFVRTGNAARMVNVLEHNFLDLVTLADILVRMKPPEGGSRQ